MEKYEHIKCMDDLMQMNDDEAIEFVNRLLDQIENREIRIDEIKSAYGFNITEAKQYLAKKFATTGQRFVKKPKIVRKRKAKTIEEKPVLSDKEILDLKQMIENMKNPVRNANYCELALAEKDATICVHITKRFQERFKEFCSINRQFNQSEHIMLAVMEYMEKYK